MATATQTKPTAALNTAPEIPSPDPVLLEDRIRERAYQIYLAKDGQAGSDMDDWLEAEREILASGVHHAKPTAR
jgi:hypothetical protein